MQSPRKVIFEAYLETASGGNVEAEFSFFVGSDVRQVDHLDRIKLRCRKCQATRTYDGSFPAYANEGTLDWGLQQWVKEHAHKEHAKPMFEDDALPTNWNHLPKKKGLPTAASVPKFKDVPKLPSVGPITPLGGPEGKPKPLKTEGRKIR